MNITFLIGNGFDLSLGMKTKYIHVYNDYLKVFSQDSVIRKFKSDLRNDSFNKYENWSDFEIGMSNYSSQLNDETELIECIRDFKSFLSKYLKKEEYDFYKKIEHPEISNKYTDEFYKSLDYFYDGLDENAIHIFREISENSNDRNYCFVTFNYTSVLDYFIKRTKTYYSNSTIYSFDNPIHIHGSLKRDIVLGIDNESQLRTTKFTLSRKGKRAFIKPFFNDCFDKVRVNNAKRTIENSDLICAFGLSFGVSDKTWTEEIKKWLIDDPNHHFVYFVYDEKKYDPCNFDAIIDVEEERKEDFLKRIEMPEAYFDKVFEQVHIPVEKSIFNFNKINHTILPKQERPREGALGLF